MAYQNGYQNNYNDVDEALADDLHSSHINDNNQYNNDEYQDQNAQYGDQNEQYYEDGQTDGYNDQNTAYNDQNTTYNDQNTAYNNQNTAYNDQNTAYNDQNTVYDDQGYPVSGGATTTDTYDPDYDQPSPTAADRIVSTSRLPEVQAYEEVAEDGHQYQYYSQQQGEDPQNGEYYEDQAVPVAVNGYAPTTSASVAAPYAPYTAADPCTVDADESTRTGSSTTAATTRAALTNLRDVVDEIDANHVRSPYADELRELLTQPHFMGLLKSHDLVADKRFFDDNAEADAQNNLEELEMRPLAEFASGSSSVQMVGIRKHKEEPLGITVREENNGDLSIARILEGSMIERQGLLHVGDIIMEINGKEVKSANQLQDIVRGLTERITMKIIPNYSAYIHNSQFYVKANFSFSPYKDNLIPCQDAGLEFRTGDILHILNKADNNWWQARHIDGRNDIDGQNSGLIPSQQLEEKRKAFVRPQYNYTYKSLLCGMSTKKKRNFMYQAKKSSDFDRNELLIYEEVVRMPPFQRKTIVLVGAQGVGRRTLKERLIKADSSRFATVQPCTSKAAPRLEHYEQHTMTHVHSNDMHAAILNNELVEYGRADGDYYGISFDSIREVTSSGRICVLDLSPKALKLIKTSEFMPYVIFIQAPHIDTMRIMHDKAYRRRKTNRKRTELDMLATKEENNRIRHDYRQHFDLTIVNDNMEKTYQKLVKAIEHLSTKAQWVPVNWVY